MSVYRQTYLTITHHLPFTRSRYHCEIFRYGSTFIDAAGICWKGRFGVNVWSGSENEANLTPFHMTGFTVVM